MSIIWTIFKILVFTGIITIIAKQSYNLIFYIGRKPYFWILFMFILNFISFFIGSKVQDSFNVVFWSSTLSLLTQLPPSKNKQEKNIANEINEDMGISNGSLKYRLGLITYVIGGIIGWIVFYGKSVSI